MIQNKGRYIMKSKSTVLAIVLLAALAMNACGQQYDDAKDFRVAPADGGRSVKISQYVGSKQTVRIPPRLEGLPVTGIGTSAFKGKDILNITIPSVVIRIWVSAFEGCRSLASITIPDKRKMTHFTQLQG